VRSLFVFILLLATLRAEVLYETDFDDFPVGANRWAGFDGWISNDTRSGAQGIDDFVLPALLNTASLGFVQPEDDFTFVALSLGYDHVAAGAPIVEIDTLLGIEDSTNNRRDDFFLSIYNSAGDRLASIRFDNQSPDSPGSQFGFWREDGVSQFDTLIDFVTGELYNLVATIDLETNTWSADLDGFPLFTDAPLTSTNAPVNFGFLAFEWDLTALTPFGHGDNFLLVADVVIQSLVEIPELNVTPVFGQNGSVLLSWETVAGWRDQVEYSTDLLTWENDLPNSTFTAPGNALFTDTSGTRGPTRYYRVCRTPE
jgi:hypothetical protein